VRNGRMSANVRLRVVVSGTVFCPSVHRWEDFEALVHEKEPKMLRAFTSMEVDSAGQLKLNEIKGEQQI
jgi:hypothetical protein